MKHRFEVGTFERLDIAATRLGLAYPTRKSLGRERFVRVRLLELLSVAAVLSLRRVVREFASEPVRMRHVQHDEAFDDLGLRHRDTPRDRTAPIVSDDRRPLRAEMTNDRNDIFDEARHRVRRHTRRTSTSVVAAKIDRDDAMVARELGHQPAPRVPVIGEPVQQNHERSFAERDRVDLDTVRIHRLVFRAFEGVDLGSRRCGRTVGSDGRRRRRADHPAGDDREQDPTGPDRESSPPHRSSPSYSFGARPGIFIASGAKRPPSCKPPVSG